MLHEVPIVRQIPGESRRRWFTDSDMDLTVWLDNRGRINGFQLCYDKSRLERALTWTLTSGFTHQRVDDGEGRPGRYKGTPILIADGAFDPSTVSRQFTEQSTDIDNSVSSFVHQKLMEYGSAHHT